MQPNNSDPVKGGQDLSKGQQSKPLQEDCKAADTIGFANRMEKVDSKFPPPTSYCVPSHGGPTVVESPKPQGHEAVTTNELPSKVPSRVTKQPQLHPIGMDSSLACSSLNHFSPLCTYSVDTEDHLIVRHVKRDHPAGLEGSQVAEVTEESADRPECPPPSEPASHHCKECGFSTADARNFHFHQERHKKTGNFQCPHCTYSDFSEFFLNHHVDTCHNDKEPKTADEGCIFIDVKAEKEEEPLLKILSVESAKWSYMEEDPLQVDIQIPEADVGLLEIDHGYGQQPHQSVLTKVEGDPLEDWLLATQPFRLCERKDRRYKSLPKFSDDEVELPESPRRPQKEPLETSPPLDVPENSPLGSPTLPAMSIEGPFEISEESRPKQPEPSASQPPSEANVNETGRERPKRGRPKGQRHKDPQRSTVMSIQPDVVELNGYAASFGQPPPPVDLDDAIVPVSRKRSRDEEVEESVEVLHCPDCPYWARSPIFFHEHYMTHKGGKAFKCSGCDETKAHILKEKADPKHRKDQAVAAQPIPSPNYVAFRRLTFVPFGAVDGWNPYRVDAQQQEDPGDSSGPPLDQSDDLEALTASSHSPYAKRKKTMRFRSAEEKESLKEMDQLESGIQQGFRSLEKGKKSSRTEPRARMEVMKGEVEAGEIRLKDLQARRVKLDGKIKEATDRKGEAELNARTRQCESLQLRLQASNPHGPKVSQRALEEADEAFRCAEAKVKRLESKLRDLQARKEDLVRQVEEAAESVAETGRRFDDMNKVGNHMARPRVKRGRPTGPQGHSGSSGVVAKEKEKPADMVPYCTASGFHCCKECDYSISHVGHFQEHREMHEKPGRFQCPVCTYSAYTEFYVEEHLTKYHSGHEVPFSCSLCKFRCKSSYTLKGHAARHQMKEETDQHQCILCSYSAGSPNHLIVHMSTGHYLHILPWVNEPQLNLHQSRDHPDDKSPTNNSMVDDVEDESDEKEPRPASDTEEIPVYHCPICPCWRKYISSFHDHILSHKSSPEFKCSNCDFSAKNRRDVSGHIRQKKELKNETHSSARVVFQPVPDHRYAAYLRPAVVPKGVNSRRSLLPTKDKKQRPARMREEDRVIRTLRRKAVAMEGKVVEALEESEGIEMRREELRMRMQGGLDGQSLEKEDEKLAVELKLAERSRIGAEKELQLLHQELKILVASRTMSS